MFQAVVMNVARSCARYRRWEVQRNYCRTTSLEERRRAALKKGYADSDLEKSRRHSAVWWKVPWKCCWPVSLGVGLDLTDIGLSNQQREKGTDENH